MFLHHSSTSHHNHSSQKYYTLLICLPLQSSDEPTADRDDRHPMIKRPLIPKLTVVAQRRNKSWSMCLVKSGKAFVMMNRLPLGQEVYWISDMAHPNQKCGPRLIVGFISTVRSWFLRFHGPLLLWLGFWIKLRGHHQQLLRFCLAACFLPFLRFFYVWAT